MMPLDGPQQLLSFLHEYLAQERIQLPPDFFDSDLENGRVVWLFDGLDEVADPNLRQRVSRLVEALTRLYPRCRYVVTSRIIGYAGSARLSEGYATATVRDFTMADIRQFLSYWHRLLATVQMGYEEPALVYAEQQTEQLLSALEDNERIRELAINPLLLTVIALVHRDRVKLPDRRAELYAEAVDVLLGKWDSAKSVVPEEPILPGYGFDIGDRRHLLQALALHMHEAEQREIEIDDLHRFLFQQFRMMAEDNRTAQRAVDRFLLVIQERTGLLVDRGEGIYAFSHLTFQEYLTALAIVEDDEIYRLCVGPNWQFMVARSDFVGGW